MKNEIKVISWWNSWLAEMGINFRTTYLLPFYYLLSIVPTMNNSWSKIRCVMHQGLSIAGQHHLLLIFYPHHNLAMLHGVWKSQKKVSFNIASEASYVYILSGQKLIKNAKNGPFRRFFENLKLAVKQCYQTGQF